LLEQNPARLWLASGSMGNESKLPKRPQRSPRV
jgi:hypothetical protein